MIPLAGVSISCRKKYTEFFLEYGSEVQSKVLGDTREIWSDAIPTNCQVVLEKNNTKRSKVASAVLKNVFISVQDTTMLQPEKIAVKRIRIQGEDNKEKEISFQRSFISSDDTKNIKIQLIDSETDLKELIKGKDFRLRIELNGKGAISIAPVNIKLEFLVRGELIKVILHQRILV